MLKETIRQLVRSTGNMSIAIGGQAQLAGINAVEQKALLEELKNKDQKNSGYAYMWN